MHLSVEAASSNSAVSVKILQNCILHAERKEIGWLNETESIFSSVLRKLKK
jgi:hypothetical protein